MKAMTICQPCASLIIGWPGMPEEERKRVENRTCRSKYRGPLLIHAGQSKKWLATWSGPTPETMTFGAILGVVTMVDCVHMDQSGAVHPLARSRYPWLEGHPHATGPECFVLQDPIRFKTPIPFPGRRGIFEVPWWKNFADC